MMRVVSLWKEMKFQGKEDAERYIDWYEGVGEKQEDEGHGSFLLTSYRPNRHTQAPDHLLYLDH